MMKTRRMMRRRMGGGGKSDDDDNDGEVPHNIPLEGQQQYHDDN